MLTPRWGCGAEYGIRPFLESSQPGMPHITVVPGGCAAGRIVGPARQSCLWLRGPEDRGLSSPSPEEGLQPARLGLVGTGLSSEPFRWARPQGGPCASERSCWGCWGWLDMENTSARAQENGRWGRVGAGAAGGRFLASLCL